MRETGRVVQIIDSHAVIEMQSHGGCHRCPLSRLCSAGGCHVTVPGSEGIVVGDLVEVEIPARGVAAAALLVFLLPLAASLAAALVASSLTDRPEWGIAGFFGCLVIVEAIVALIDRRWGTKEAFQPAIRGKAPDEAQPRYTEPE